MDHESLTTRFVAPVPAGFVLYGNPQIGFAHRPIEPSNDVATTALVTSVSALTFLFYSLGLLAPFTVVASAVGIVLGRKGMNAVDRGQTPKDRATALGGFVTGIIGVVAALLAAAAWLFFVFVVLADWRFS